ncbi:hypothetical protein V6N13_122054 [Hibiscus sabdariffa]
MDESSSYSNLPTSHLLGSVPSVINEEQKASYSVPEASMQYFPPNNGSGGSRGRGYQTLEAPTASGIYGYAIVVPLAFYFLLQYLGSNASLVRFWCMWGYSLSIFIPTAFLLLIPVEFLRWMIILIAGTASACFVYLNLRSYIEGVNDLTIMVVAAFLLQMALAIFIKVWFFP